MNCPKDLYVVFDTCLDNIELISVYDNFLEAEIRATRYGYSIFKYTFNQELWYHRNDLEEDSKLNIRQIVRELDDCETLEDAKRFFNNIIEKSNKQQ